MTGKELRELVGKGITPIVEFTECVEELEERFTQGMRAYVTSVTFPDNEGIVEITFEENNFTEYNENIEMPIWYNYKTGKFDLKYKDTIEFKNYKGIVKFYEEGNEEVCNFKIIENESLKLFNNYQAEKNSEITYIKWLENKVLKYEIQCLCEKDLK
jgi:hypothetical protein